jgi:hypothetical protein
MQSNALPRYLKSKSLSLLLQKRLFYAWRQFWTLVG